MGTIRTLGYGFAWNTSALVIGKLIGFANMFMVLTHLTVYEYGLTELTFSAVSTISLFLLPGLVATITSDLGVERGRQGWGKMKALFLEYFFFSCVLGVLAWAFLFFGSSFVAHVSGNDLIDRFFKIVSFLFLIAPMRIATTMLAIVMVRYADLAFFSVIEEGVKGLLLAIFFFWLERGADGLLLAAVLAQLGAVLLFVPRTLSAYRIFSHASEVPREPFSRMLRDHRKWSVASSYVGTLSQNIRLWIIKILLGTEAVGLFAFAYGIMSHLASALPLNSLITPLVPGLVDKRIELARLIRATIKVQFAVSVSISAIFICFGYVFVEHFFPQYLAAIPLAYVIMITFILSSIGTPLTPVFIVLQEQRSFFTSQVLKLCIMLTVLPLAISVFGLVGIGIELALTVFGNICERFYRFRRLVPEFSMRPRDVFSLDSHERNVIKLIFRALKSRFTRVIDTSNP